RRVARRGSSGNTGMVPGGQHMDAVKAPGNGSNGSAQTPSVLFPFFKGVRRHRCSCCRGAGLLVCADGVGRAPATTPNHRADGRPVAAPSNSKGSPPGTARHRLVLLGFWAGKGHAAQRSGPCAPGNAVFALLYGTGTGRRPVVGCSGWLPSAVVWLWW